MWCMDRQKQSTSPQHSQLSMSLTCEQFSDAWRAAAAAAAAAAAPPCISCNLHKLAGKEGDVVDVSVTVKAAEQPDFRSRCAFIFLIDNR